MSNDVLLIFLTDTEKSSVLSLALGKEKAKEITEKLETLTHAITEKLACRKIVFYQGNEPADTIWNKDTYTIQAATGKYLNNKIEHAFSEYIIQDKEDINKVIFILADCPNLTAGIIEKAFESLNKHDVCIGPEKKGSYYLIGMKEPLSFLFSNKLWSDKQLLDASLEELIEQGKKYYTLPELQCVNDIYDLQLLK